jgi:hypothetical protein
MDFLITQDEIEALPEDARERFVALEAICRKRHYEETAAATREEQWDLIQDSRLRYMSTVVSAAKFLKIEFIKDLEIPKRKQFDNDAYADFVHELQHYVVQLMLEGAERNIRASIVLEGSTRDRLSTLLSHLRDQVKKLDLSPARIDRLVKQIDDFEKDLRNPRLKFTTVAIFTLGVIAGVADLGGATDVVRKLVHQMEEAIGRAKEEQDKEAAGRLLPSGEIRQLTPPRKSEPRTNKSQRLEPAGDFGRSPASRAPRDDLDDDIPF